LEENVDCLTENAKPHLRTVEQIYALARSLAPKKLAIVQVGDNQASNLYISIKQKRLAEVGFLYQHFRLDEGINKNEFEEVLKSCARDDSIDGIIVQLPIPQQLFPSLELIPPHKDADGITLYNQALLFRQADPRSYLAPATALGCMAFLEAHLVSISGIQVAVFGKSFLVGKPIACLLQASGASVVSLSRHDQNQQRLSSCCDILIAAMGSPNYITPDYVKPGAFVVDIGVTKVGEKVLGDVHPDVEQRARFVSKTKGDIGPLTVAFLISNLMKCSELREGKAKKF
jgi:methylenetetrahydrofolate dehydrogenase (NADP+)/methenyltetrahydrofolate cyclohydrolase